MVKYLDTNAKVGLNQEHTFMSKNMTMTRVQYVLKFTTMTIVYGGISVVFGLPFLTI